MSDLNMIRENIDKTDQEIIKLLEKRIGLAKEVADYKLKTGKAVFDPVREAEKLERVRRLVEADENKADIAKIFEQIMQNSRKIQYRQLEENGQSKLDPYEIMDEVRKDGVKVAYQGIEGAYSHIAARRFFGSGADTYKVNTWRDAIKEVLEDKADFAVLPIENSTAGSVTEIYDLLFEYPVYIVAETFVKINHALLGLPGARISDIKKVYSHPQAFFQCDGFLEKHKDWERKTTSNTALSAKLIKELGSVENAAIASEEAALYGLDILEKNINDLKNNTTRFVIIFGKRRFRKDAGKVSVIFETANEKGSLYNLLSPIVSNDLNMIKIESRPMHSKVWDSRFFVDFEGNLRDVAVKNALRAIYEESKYMRLLGNY